MVSCPGRFTPEHETVYTCWIGGWIGPRAGLNAVASAGNRILAVQPAARRYTDWHVSAEMLNILSGVFVVLLMTSRRVSGCCRQVCCCRFLPNPVRFIMYGLDSDCREVNREYGSLYRETSYLRLLPRSLRTRCSFGLLSLAAKCTVVYAP
jgi:hypothetical protein